MAVHRGSDPGVALTGGRRVTGLRLVPLLAGLALPMLVLGACGAPDEVALTEAPTSTTGPSLAGDPVPDNGWIQVGGLTLDLAFTCFAPGAGDVVAVGVGEHPVSGLEVKALVQGFLGRPYVGVMVGGEVMFEAALDDPLDVYVHDNKITENRGLLIFRRLYSDLLCVVALQVQLESAVHSSRNSLSETLSLDF